MKVLIISGPSGSGKSTLLAGLGQAYPWPVLSKDEFKERLFDALGWSDRAFSQKIGGASYDLLLMMAQKLMQTKTPYILESKLSFNFESRLEPLIAAFGYQSLVVHLTADRRVLAHRFRQRSYDGSRHPGHQDQENLLEFEKTLLTEDIFIPTKLGKVVVVDTTRMDPAQGFGDLIERTLTQWGWP